MDESGKFAKLLGSLDIRHFRQLESTLSSLDPAAPYTQVNSHLLALYDEHADAKLDQLLRHTHLTSDSTPSQMLVKMRRQDA